MQSINYATNTSKANQFHNPLTPTFCHYWYSYKAASDCPDVKNCKWRLNPVWQRMLYSCTNMATVGIKGL